MGLSHNIYAVRGARQTRPSKRSILCRNASEAKDCKTRTAKAKDMLRIEQYAKQNKVSLDAAMVAFVQGRVR